MPRRTPTPLDRARPKVPPLAAATLRFANSGIFQFADNGPIDSATHEVLGWLRDVVAEQLQLVIAGGFPDAQVDCTAWYSLHEWMMARHRALQASPGVEGTISLATVDETIEMTAVSLHNSTTLGAQQLVPLRSRLRRCKDPECQAWFVATDVRTEFHQPRCKSREYRQRPEVKLRA